MSSMIYSQWSLIFRGLGFKKEWDTRAGGQRAVQFNKKIEGTTRTLQIQWWEDEQHRVSSEFNGCADTRPIDFDTVSSLLAAIEFESSRTDSKYCNLKLNKDGRFIYPWNWLQICKLYSEKNKVLQSPK